MSAVDVSQRGRMTLEHEWRRRELFRALLASIRPVEVEEGRAACASAAKPRIQTMSSRRLSSHGSCAADESLQSRQRRDRIARGGIGFPSLRRRRRLRWTRPARQDASSRRPSARVRRSRKARSKAGSGASSWTSRRIWPQAVAQTTARAFVSLSPTLAPFTFP